MYVTEDGLMLINISQPNMGHFATQYGTESTDYGHLDPCNF